MKDPIIVEDKQSKEVAIAIGKECVREFGKTFRDIRGWSGFQRDLRLAIISGFVGFVIATLLITLRLVF